MIGALYIGFNLLSVVTLIWSFARRRRSSVLFVCGILSVLFGAVLAGLFIQDGTSFAADLPDWLFALVPLVCGCISCVRFLFVRHERAA